MCDSNVKKILSGPIHETFSRNVPSNAKLRPPRQPLHRVARRTVLATYPTLIPQPVHRLEHIGPANLSGPRLMPRRHIRNLHMRNHRHQRLHSLCDVPLRHLTVINVELKPNPLPPQRLHHRRPLRRRVQKEPRHVPVIDRLQHDRHPLPRSLLRCPGQIRRIHRPRHPRPQTGRRNPRHHMQHLVPQHPRIRQRPPNPLPKLPLPTRQARHPPLAPRPIPRRRIEQHHRQPMRIEPRPDLRRRVLIRK